VQGLRTFNNCRDWAFPLIEKDNGADIRCSDRRRRRKGNENGHGIFGCYISHKSCPIRSLNEWIFSATKRYSVESSLALQLS